VALKLGTELTAQDQQTALHNPRWPRTKQFPDDAGWLAHTRFRVNGKGRLDARARYCYPVPPPSMIFK